MAKKWHRTRAACPSRRIDTRRAQKVPLLIAEAEVEVIEAEEEAEEDAHEAHSQAREVARAWFE